MARAGAPGQLRPSPPLEEAALCVPGSPLDKGPAARAKQAAAAAVAAVPPATPVTTAFPFRIFLSFHRTGSVTDTHTPIVKCATLAVREDGGLVWSTDGAPFAHPACRVCYRLCRVSVCRLVMNSHLTSRGQKNLNGVTRINIFEPNSPRRVFQQLDGSAPANQIDRTLRQSSDSRTDGPYL